MINLILAFYLDLNACLTNINFIYPIKESDKINICVKLITRERKNEIK